MKNKWVILVSAALGFFIVNFDGGAIGILLPTLQGVFSAEFYQVQWVWLSGLTTIVVVLAVAGRLGDVLGKRPVYLLGCLLYIIGSVLAVFAPAVSILIVARVIQASGITAFLGLGAAIVTEAFGDKDRGLALGLYNLLGLFGILGGPLAAGAFLSSGNWGLVFVVAAGLTFLTFLAALFFLPRESKKQERERRPFDFFGTCTLLLFLGTFLLALTLGQDAGYGSMVILILFAVSITSLALFIRIERRVKEPIIVLSFFRSNTFSCNLILLLFAMIALNGYGFLMPFYLQNVLGLSAIQMGVLLALVFGLIMAVTAPLGGAISDKIGTWNVTLFGLVFLLAGTLAATSLGTDSTQLQFLLCFAPVGIGIGLLITPCTSAIMGSLPKERLGMGSSLVSIVINTAQSLGIAILGTFWSARTLSRIEIPLKTEQAVPGEIQAAALRETFFLAAGLILLGIAVNTFGIIKNKKNRASLNTSRSEE